MVVSATNSMKAGKREKEHMGQPERDSLKSKDLEVKGLCSSLQTVMH